MENRTIRSTPLWRLIILVLTVAALAATVVNVARSWATPPSWPASCAGPWRATPTSRPTTSPATS